MTRSGIKQGLAISAVSALSIVGLPAAAHAAATPVDSISISASAASAQAFQTVAIKGVAAVDGNPVGNADVAITLSQKIADTDASGTAGAAPEFYADDAAATPTVLTGVPAAPLTGTANADHTHTFKQTFTVTSSNVQATLGQWKANVGSSVAGTLSVSAAVATLGATPATSSTSITVAGKGSTNPDDATALKISSSSAVSAYVDSTTPGNSDPISFKLNATDGANGVLVPAFNGTVGGTYAIAATSAPTTPLATGTWNSPVQAFSADPYTSEVTIPSTGLTAGSYVVEFWVNQDNHTTNTAKPDAGEPTAIGSINVTDEPTADAAFAGAPGTVESGLKYDDGAAYYGTATAFGGVNDSSNNLLPAGEAASIPLSFQVYEQTRSGALNKLTYPAAGTSFAFDVYNSATGKTVRVPASYNATTGLVTGSASVAKDDAVDGEDIEVTLFVSKDATDVGAGNNVNTVTVSSFDARTTAIKQIAAYDITASKGGAVSIPVAVADQFGKASAGDTLQFTVAGAGGFALTTTTAPTDATGRTTISYTNDKVTTLPASDTVTVADTTHPSVTGIGAPGVTVKYINGTTAAAQISKVATSNVKPTDPEVAPLDANGDGVHDSSYTVASAGSASTSGAYAFYVLNAKSEALTNTTVTLTATGGEVTWTDGNGKAHTGASVTATTDSTGHVGGVYLSSKKVGNVALTVAAGAASYSFAPIKVTTAGAPYSVAAVTAPVTIVPGASAKFIFKLTDEWGNPVQGAQVAFSLGSNTAPGTLNVSSAFGAGVIADKDGNVVAVVDTAANDLGAGSVVAKPVDPTIPGALTWASAPAPTTDAATATFTDKTGDGVTIAYTVAKPVTPQPQPQPQPQPKPVAINKVKGHSQGKKDVLVVRVANANGKRVVVRVHGHKVGTAVVKHGKAVVKVRDHNGKKKTNYKVIVAGVKKFIKVK